MIIIEPVLTVVMIVEALIGLIFLILTIAVEYLPCKITNIILSVIGTAGIIFTTVLLKNELSGFDTSGSYIGSIINFTVTAILAGVSWCLGVWLWFGAISTAREGDWTELLPYFLVEAAIAAPYLLAYLINIIF